MLRRFGTATSLLLGTLFVSSCGCGSGPNASGDLCAESTAAGMLPLMIVSAPAIGAVNLARATVDPGADILLSNAMVPVEALTWPQLQAALESQKSGLENGGGYSWTVTTYNGSVTSPTTVKDLADAAGCVSVSNINSSGHFVCVPKAGAARMKLMLKVIDASSRQTITESDPGICIDSNGLTTALTDSDQIALSCTVNGGFGGTPALFDTPSGWVRVANDTKSVASIPHSSFIVVGTNYLSRPDQSQVGSWFHRPSADEYAGAIIVDGASEQNVTTVAKTPNLATGHDGKLVVFFGHETARVFRVEGTTLFPIFELRTGKRHPFTALAINDETHAIVARNDQTAAGFSSAEADGLPPLSAR